MWKTTIYNIADAFLTMEPVSHKKLQKLCYYAYSWYFTLNGERLFPNSFQAWIHGPVDPGLYQEYRDHGWQPIPMKESVEIEPDIYEFLRNLHKSYGGLTGDELEFLTHNEDPWIEARGGLPEYAPCKSPIKDEVIKHYFMRVYEEGQND